MSFNLNINLLYKFEYSKAFMVARRRSLPKNMQELKRLKVVTLLKASVGETESPMFPKYIQPPIIG